MAGIPWLEADDAFPPVACALNSPNGLLAAGGDLSAERLIDAYRRGVFPWYEDDQPLLWWSPDPRAVLKPQSIKISRSLRKRLKRSDFDVYIDRDFVRVMVACAGRREYADGTWITDEMIDAYTQLHDLGVAHSIEAYLEDELVGGLYGVCLGSLFCGESMFHTATDASKVAFAHLAKFMGENGAELIDCQLENSHLMSLGCELISRADYVAKAEVMTTQATPDWTPRRLAYDWFNSILPP